MGKTKVTRTRSGTYTAGYDAGGGGSAVSQSFGTLVIHDQKQLATGEVFVRSLVYGNGLLWGLCSTGPGKLIRFNNPSADLSDYTVFTFPNDSGHWYPVSMDYSPASNRIYVIFGDSVNQVITVNGILALPSPSAIAIDTVYSTVISGPITTTPAIAVPRVETAGNICYLCIPSAPTKIERRNVVTGALLNTRTLASGFDHGDSIVSIAHSGTTNEEVVVSGTSLNTGNSWIGSFGGGSRAFTVHTTYTFTTPDVRTGLHSSDGFATTNPDANFPFYVGFRGPTVTAHQPGPQDYLKKFTSDINAAPVNVAMISNDPNPRQTYGIWAFPPYLYALSADGYSAIVRINPSTDGTTEYAFPTSLLDANAMAVDPAGNIYVAFLVNQPGIVVRCTLT